MANILDGLLARVDDPALRDAIASEVDRLRDNKDFGLVFERHLPENVLLFTHPVRRGLRVQDRSGTDDTTWLVKRVRSGIAELVDAEGTTAEREVEDLVVVRRFGETIYPGLAPLGSLDRGGERPYHAVIKGENFHVLETLLYAYEGAVDAIYIDPPYNTGARDWKYSNDYVDDNDRYRHSKWLAFMERRLQLARRLLRRDDSVLIVTIDEKEYLRLGLLLEQVFPDARIQMASIAINPAGVARRGGFSRSDEYAFFVMRGDAAPARLALGPDWIPTKGRTHKGEIRWDLLRRSGTHSSRAERPGLFFPIYIDPAGPRFQAVGDPLPAGTSTPPVVEGAVAVLPIRKNGSEGVWQAGPAELRTRIEQGRVRISGSAEKGYVLYYLATGEYQKVLDGTYPVLGHGPDGSMITAKSAAAAITVATTQWRIPSHDSTQYGSRLLAELIPDRRFPFPKSLYAVEDSLRFFLHDKPDALVVDFFGGSGTTTHAVMRLNHHDDGRRRSILVTNNEVSEDEAKSLAAANLRPGDPAWEAEGIFEHITRPRITAAVEGKTATGDPIRGEYKFVDEFPMSDGFAENVKFFELSYLDVNDVSRGRAFEAIAPLLWMKAGGTGELIDKVTPPYATPAGARYAVLFDVSAWPAFVDQVRDRSNISHFFVVTDSLAHFQQVTAELPPTAEATMLYEDYLRNFEINIGEVL